MQSGEDPIADCGPPAAWGHVEATDTVHEAAAHSTNKRSSYRRVRRPSALPAPREAHSEVLNGQALHEGLTDITMNHELQATSVPVLDVLDVHRNWCHLPLLM